MVIGMFRKWWFKWLVVGILIRLILMPITVHPDLWVFTSAGYFSAYEGRLSIYEDLANLSTNEPNHPLIKIAGNINDYFIYPPLAYFTFGTFQTFLKPLLDPNFIPQYWSNPDSVFTNPSLPWHLFLYKLPSLFIDIATAFLLAGLFEKQSRKKLAFIFWMFNPLTVYSTFMMGQFDIIPVLFTVFALALAKKKNYFWAILSLGVAGSFKIYPLLLIPPIAFLSDKDLWSRLKYLVLGFLPFLITIASYISSPAFRQMVLFSSKNQKMLFLGLPVSGAEVLYPFLIILFLIYFHSLYSKKTFELYEYFLIILLTMFSVSNYHPQWFLWITPFLIIYLIKYNFKYALLVVSLFGVWLVLTLLFESSLSYGLFNPIFPKLKDAKSFADVFISSDLLFKFKSIIRSIFAAVSIYIFISINQKEGNYTS
ncbi:hypothetical protein A2962_03340 [Candidatus Woesebacteria bacterium RIFCSPLOWO2_01_FULL_39_61]|uniref:Glycosyltransferase RgtA/B/C/D-like domain-containing protein n=1 Tax=Candidatus Woesebacteria bacterium RIFCSPHIGHO2_02_FULL_39_13 TaxID=1802505 RepID=A0A1F7Z2T7_9BACT|nr:MAG: hypothetical protein A2692_04425 [Candidatus Woesebacteria bacterium RIFCSPHIGHO2_01_FULL_39_95]OGM33857.1 MAG: hypothetical protein A3D01_02710 [Candidatus Woesebacteria bacterium RIFCSPHIGHO2_02_FULL_39_13]OGM39018.1 MAG: hypothetical protein A3E13_04980 [Candidatus Woesebacteria bacterium RIFCSPHIGHO2_12_FULL_40_20]OGM67523.1 MAG: hypothetical protein A2962_03340 [Candidatus Woesebacteria bacterium RIFCSPLOWO2_01_FULL_39_61]OGM72854.1 MAG: hypothetical protein A3H19_05845 [Candidatus